MCYIERKYCLLKNLRVDTAEAERIRSRPAKRDSNDVLDAWTGD